MDARLFIAVLVTALSGLLAGPALAQVKLLPLDPLLFAQLKADPMECRSGMLFADTDLGGPSHVVTRVGMRAVMAHFPLNPGMDAQLVAVALGQGRFDLSQDTELVSEDWRWGLAFQTRWGPWAYAFEVVHLSAHLGDEFMVRTGTPRLEYVQEEVGLKVSWDSSDHLRLYYGGHYALGQSHVDSPVRLQVGGEWFLAPRLSPGGMGPYLALDAQARSEVDYRPTTTALVGWAFPGLAPGRTIDLVASATSGPTTQRQFFRSDETLVGLGFLVDL